MTAPALFDLLKDFATRPPPAPAIVSASPVIEPGSPRSGMEELVRAEVAKAEAALEGRLVLAHEAELEALRQEHAARIDEVFSAIGETAGETIALRLGEMEERLGHRAAPPAARCGGVSPRDDLDGRTLERQPPYPGAAVEERETFRIDIRGPQSLYEALQRTLGDRAGNFGYVEAPGFDLSVTIDGNLFETRLTEWSAVLSEILE